MFCTKCGNNNPDGVMFCTSCGARMMSSATPVSMSKGDINEKSADLINKAKSNKLFVLIGGGALVTILLIIIICTIVVRSGVNGAINKLEKGVKKCDAQALIELTMPKSAIDTMIEENYDGDKREYKENMKEAKGKMKESLDNEDVKIVSVKRYGKIEKLDLYERKNMIDIIESLYNIEVTDVKKCDVRVVYKEDGDKERYTTEFTFYKSKGKWYVYGLGVFNPLMY